MLRKVPSKNNRPITNHNILKTEGIPILFLNNEFDHTKNKPVMPLNENFVEEVKQEFKKTDTLMVMCRSCGRSAIAINLMAKTGFENVYNIIDGFEGDKLNIEGSYNNGRRLINGWKNSEAPWIYKLNSKLMYLPGNEKRLEKEDENCL